MREYRPGETIDGRWLVRRALQGGLGRVYIVLDLRDRIPLALKTFQVEQADPEVMARFRQECYAWIQMGNHPHLVRAHQFLPFNDENYLFLEYVDGGDLSHWIGTPRLSDHANLLRLALQFCDGMIHARSRGLVAHRDIKPENCMLTSQGDLKITDFGLAKAAGARGLESLGPATEASQIGLTGAGAMLGTVTHMAPEQFEDAANVDVRADIYAFGVMFFQMITGRLPFLANNLMQLAVMHASQPPPRLSDAAWDDCVQACLAKEPGQRPADFAQLRGWLEELHQQRLGRPAPPPPPAGDFDILELDRKAMALSSLGYLDQAVELWAQGLELRPDLRPLWMHMGFALNQLHRPREALAHLQKALTLGQDASTWVEAGLSLELLNSPQQAEIAYQRAVQLDDAYAQGYYSLGALLSGQGRLQEGIENFRQAIRLAPDMGGFRVGLGMALLNAGRAQEAAQAFQECLERDSTHARAWSYLGDCHLLQGDFREAERCLRRAVVLEPESGQHWLALGRFYLRARQPEQALECLLRADQLEPDHPATCEALGRIYLQMGDQALGLARLQQSADLGHAGAAQMLATLRRGM